MYIYRVIVSDYEDHTELWYKSDGKYSHDEFRSIVKDCLDKTIQHYCNLSVYDWDVPCLVDTDDFIRYPQFREFMVVAGFSPLEVEAGCGFGNDKIFKDSDKYRLNGVCEECFRDSGCAVEHLKIKR